MPITPARRKANEKYNAKAYDEIKIRVKKGEKEVLSAHVENLGKSLNAYINELIDADIKIYKLKGGS